MQKSDRIYLSQFALDPDPEAVLLEDFDMGDDPEIGKIADEGIFEDDCELIDNAETKRSVWPYRK
jgi:hypothetical protein